jgi:hypothetical protein
MESSTCRKLLVYCLLPQIALVSYLEKPILVPLDSDARGKSNESKSGGIGCDRSTKAMITLFTPN